MRPEVDLSDDGVFLSVRLLDLDAGEVLDFDTYVFLPGNNKYVKISHSGDFLDEEKIEKIKRNRINKLYVSAEQLQKFYNYSAQKLRRIGDSKKLAPSERTEKLIDAVKELMTDLFSLGSSKSVNHQDALKNCSEIISAYMLLGPEPEWFLRVQEILSQLGERYSHSANVSTLGALFSIGTCIGKPENLALAGLLHDIGESQLEDIQGLAEADLTPNQLKRFQTHPELSMKLLTLKRIIVSESVANAILQHHEFFNGKGFPKGLAGKQVSLEAQILSFADYFDKFMKPKPESGGMSPEEAVKIFRDENSLELSKRKYCPDLLNDLLHLLPA